ncbi:MAG: zinc-binding dehydrogenase [Gaiellales bacterium]
MRAVLLTSFGGSDVLEVADVPVPQPGRGQLLVRIRAGAVNPVDYQTRRGDYRDEIALPAIIGSDLSGVVEATGPGVRSFRPGDEVFGMTRAFDGNGAYAQYAVIDEAIVARKPESLSHDEAASLPVAGGTAWECLVVRGRLRVGETVLVHAAAGGVGSLALQIARAAGARIVATCSSRSVELVRQLGADVVVDYTREDYVAGTLAAAGGRGVDLVLDTIGGDAIARAGEVLADGGRVVSIVDIATPQSLLPLWASNASAHFVFTPPRRSTLEALGSLCERGLVSPVIDSVVPLGEVAAAHDRLERGGVRGKIVLDPDR